MKFFYKKFHKCIDKDSKKQYNKPISKPLAEIAESKWRTNKKLIGYSR